MQNWQTNINIRTGQNNVKINPIKIKRGYSRANLPPPPTPSAWRVFISHKPSFQRPQRVRIWLPSRKSYGWSIHYVPSALCGRPKGLCWHKKTTSAVQNSEPFCNTLRIESGLDKRRTLNIGRGKLELEDFENPQGEIAEPVDESGIYKYLGTLRYRRKQTTEMTSRLQKTMKTNLIIRSLKKATNTYVALSWTYSYGVTSRSQTDVKSLKINIRTKMTKARKHHKKCSSETYDAEGKNGLIHNLHNNQVKQFKKML